VLSRVRKVVDANGIDVPESDVQSEVEGYYHADNGTSNQSEDTWRTSKGTATGDGHVVSFEPPPSKADKRVRYNYSYATGVLPCGTPGSLIVVVDDSENAPARIANEFGLPDGTPLSDPWGPPGIDQSERDEAEGCGRDSGTDSSGGALDDQFDVFSMSSPSTGPRHAALVQVFDQAPGAWLVQHLNHRLQAATTPPPHPIIVRDLEPSAPREDS
jgi:hypothetical protein